MTDPNQAPDPLVDLLRQGAALNEAESQRARASFLERVDRELPEKGRFDRRYWVAPLALAAAVALAMLVWPKQSLTYEVVGADQDSGYIRAVGETPATIRFEDKTVLRAAKGTRFRVVETHADGARVAVEQGALDVHVTHTDSSSWNFVAGPFNVHVTGTRFDLVWSAETERLRVDLHEGSVEIAGYAGSGPMAVQAGQRFVGDALKRTMQVSSLASLDDDNDTSPSTNEVTSGAVDSKQPETGSPPPHGKSVGTKKTGAASVTWSTLVSKGQFLDVVAAAEQRGVSSCLSSCGASDLGALADAARYTSQNDLSRRSLQALRSRFPGSWGARAAFLLGRLDEAHGNMNQARTWYETTLREAPGGNYAGEALAGKMRAVLALQGAAAARPIAREYLKRYPGGVHSAAAKKINQP